MVKTAQLLLLDTELFYRQRTDSVTISNNESTGSGCCLSVAFDWTRFNINGTNFCYGLLSIIEVTVQSSSVQFTVSTGQYT
jgi:hypothetical protein